MKTKVKAIVSIVIGIALAEVFYVGYKYYLDNRMPALEREAMLQIYPETTIDEVIAQIDSLCVISHPISLERVFQKEQVGIRLNPGSYLLKPEYSARYIARMITRGWQDPVNLVISGRIQTVGTLAGIISSQMMTTREQMLSALRDSVFLATLGTTPSKVFQIIIPDTYEMYWSASPQDIITRLKKERDKFWNEERLAAAAKQGLSPEEVSTLASIVSEETNKKDEFPKIASVYLTRLHRGIKLQACPTIGYLFDYKIVRVLNSHLKTDSPYNTYMYEGLPPGPIALPDKVHIEAVLHPDSTPYMFFCADSSFNGRNVFSTTYDEHIRRKNEYVQALELRRALKKQAADTAMMQQADTTTVQQADTTDLQR